MDVKEEKYVSIIITGNGKLIKNVLDRGSATGGGGQNFKS